MHSSTKYRFLAFALFVFIMAAAITGNFVPPAQPLRNLGIQLDTPRFQRSASDLDYSGVSFTPWETVPQLDTRQKKSYTIMIYLNGSDLESETGAATADLKEMRQSGLGNEDVNVILFTGGTNRWKTPAIPENTCAVWELANGELNKLADVGLRSMGDAGTLAGFLELSMDAFPAERYALILWDHGGGAIAGYGYDEKFDSGLSLLALNYAFEQSPLAEQKLEMLGFDACLMATAEMAVVAADYADYMVASEDLEPNDGWNYQFLSALARNPHMDGEILGREIVDSYVRIYGRWTDTPMSLSVTRLSEAAGVMEAMGVLMNSCAAALEEHQETAFLYLSERRLNTRTFGNSSPRDAECDMVDVGDMAKQLAASFPGEAAQVEAALSRAVVYNRHSAGRKLSGLSAYYVYAGKENGGDKLGVYADLRMSDAYTAYMYEFYSHLTGKPTREDALISELTLWQKTDNGYLLRTVIDGQDIRTEEEITAALAGKFPLIDGEAIPFYRISDDLEDELYAVPANLNGRNGDIIILKSENFPEGKILGFRNEDGLVLQKGYDPVEDGDEIFFWYQRRDTADAADETADWQEGAVHRVNGSLRLTWQPIHNSGFYHSFRTTDHRGNRFFGVLG